MYVIFEVFMFVTARLINLSYVVLLMPGLGYMLIEGAYTDAFIVHEKSVYMIQSFHSVMRVMTIVFFMARILLILARPYKTHG